MMTLRGSNGHRSSCASIRRDRHAHSVPSGTPRPARRDRPDGRSATRRPRRRRRVPARSVASSCVDDDAPRRRGPAVARIGRAGRTPGRAGLVTRRRRATEARARAGTDRGTTRSSLRPRRWSTGVAPSGPDHVDLEFVSTALVGDRWFVDPPLVEAVVDQDHRCAGIDLPRTEIAARPSVEDPNGQAWFASFVTSSTTCTLVPHGHVIEYTTPTPTRKAGWSAA